MPLVEWDGTGMICVFDDDRYFSSAEEFYEWCAEDDITPDDVMLVTCIKQGMSEIDSDRWADELAEDQELPGAMAEALEALNKIIREQETLTYWPGGQRVILKSVSSEDVDVGP